MTRCSAIYYQYALDSPNFVNLNVNITLNNEYVNAHSGSSSS